MATTPNQPNNPDPNISANNAAKMLQNFEMGSPAPAGTNPNTIKTPASITAPAQSEPTPPVTPQINRYENQVKTPSPTPKVAPTAGAPIPPTPVTPVPSPKPTSTTIQAGATPPSNPIAKKKAILGCLGAFASLTLILIIMSFVFLAQTTPGGTNPIAKMLGVNPASFTNGIINFINIIFILVALVAFIFTMVGLFKAGMSQKNDKEGRKANMKTALISGITFIMILIIWGIVFVYLDSKKVYTAGATVQSIITDPPNTLNLITGQSAPVDIKFDASKVPFTKNSQVVSYDWDFGDGSTGGSQVTFHTFKIKGTFDVKLVIMVKDITTGKISVGAEQHVTVTVDSQALTAIIKATPESGEAPLEVSFDAGDSADPDGKIKSYGWDFNLDGNYEDATGPLVTHTFDKIGKYKVSLQIVSATDKHAEVEKEINVVEQSNPVAVISVVNEPKEFLIGQSYIFQGENSTSPNGKINKYNWTFSDSGKTETTKSISHSFNKIGSYEIDLKVTDEKDKTADVKKIIQVVSAKGTPKAKINTDPALAKDATSLSGKAPFTVTFDAKGTTDIDNNIVDYKWDFDSDGKFDSVGNVVSHTYTLEGIYTVELEVEDTDNNTGKASMVVKVESAGVVAMISADKLDGNVPLTIDFDASGSSYSKGQISSYKWNFGDGTPDKIGAATISHKYTAVGSYPVSVTVIASDGNKATKTITITVREIPLMACFTSVFENGLAPLENSFDPSCSTGTISSYFWDFADGSTSSSVKPTHIFKEPGDYTVTLEVSDSQKTVSKSQATIKVGAK